MTVLGLPLGLFTEIHVVISLIAIFTGVMLVRDMRKSRPLGIWNPLFLITIIATSVTGFLFPFKAFGPPHIVGAISLVILAIALMALYLGRLVGRWRWAYAISIICALYFDVFVAVLQAFDKIPALHRYAPTGSEPPLTAAQGLVLLVFLVVGFIAARRFRATGP